MLEVELLLDGALLDPAAALPLGWLGCWVAELEELDAPPAAESFFSSVVVEPETAAEPLAGALGAAVDEELEELDWSFLVMSTEAEPDCEPDGAVVEPAEEDEDEPAGGVVRETVRSPSLSQPVNSPAPSARDTATAKAESLM